MWWDTARRSNYFLMLQVNAISAYVGLEQMDEDDVS
jgi:hypothetical protein